MPISFNSVIIIERKKNMNLFLDINLQLNYSLYRNLLGACLFRLIWHIHREVFGSGNLLQTRELRNRFPVLICLKPGIIIFVPIHPELEFSDRLLLP